jgi:pyruvate/2-oxoacid:ferredoxin oxidoreductase beta subunit
MDQFASSLVEAREQFISPGHMACGGCTAVLALRHILEVMGKNTVLVLPASCTSVYIGGGERTSLRIPCTTAAFETGGATAAGLRAGFLAQGLNHVQVLAFVGDGGTYDIGLQSLSAAAERNEDIIYVCYDNEAYMNTGVQRSSATPKDCWTTTTPLPLPKREVKKNIVEIMAAHRIPYIATATVAFLADLKQKVEQAKGISGMRFLHILTPCVTGWRVPSSKAIKISRLAVETGVFPLLEIRDGVHWRLTLNPGRIKPLKEYTALQGRFRHLDDHGISEMEARVRDAYELVEGRARAASSRDIPIL